MVRTDRATLPLLDGEGRTRGSLELVCLPRSQDHLPALLDVTDVAERGTLEAIQLLESTEYRYRIFINDERGAATTDKPDLFDADNLAGTEGRLNTRLHTGLVQVTVYSAGEEVGCARFEVRSRKLDYLRHYRWMLNNIAEVLSDLVMERFAPSAQRFEVDTSRDSRSLYQRFAFLNSLIESERFDLALSQVLTRPHRVWNNESVLKRPEQGLPGRRDIAREIARGHPRVPWTNASSFSSVPARVHVSRYEQSLDTAENRFIKFALEDWRDLADRVAMALKTTMRGSGGKPVPRGIAEAEMLATRLSQLLSADLFREVGDLGCIPFGSQVLQKRAGYRDILEFYLQTEFAAAVVWEGGDDVYGAGQRNVATLYEYWAFLQVATVVASLCGGALDTSGLLVETADGLGIGLRRGSVTTVHGRVARLGRILDLELRFNQPFGASAKHESWTVQLRPDVSLSVMVLGREADRVWLHFDAKYRIDALREIFASDDGPHDLAWTRGSAERTDIIKMHAYRDAIRRSAGAYVLYPGTETEQRMQYHELLPGVGAFALRPSEAGSPEGLPALTNFIDDVLTHVASQYTQHERGRYWVSQVHRSDLPYGQVAQNLSFLTRPPSDSTVLLAEIKSAAELLRLRDDRRFDIIVSNSLPAQLLRVDFLLCFGVQVNDCEVRTVIADPEVRGWAMATVRVSLVLGDAVVALDQELVMRARALLAAGHVVVSGQDLGVR